MFIGNVPFQHLPDVFYRVQSGLSGVTLTKKLLNRSYPMQDGTIIHEKLGTWGVKMKDCRMDLIGKNVHVILGRHPNFQKQYGTSAKSAEHILHHDTPTRILAKYMSLK
ncbi:hypothetical protein AVEN_96848-1 [Araneus ventricosus]|uniref:Uncharacterized protein n=1 Tax=Araneus ventricosus TaxID=182803 RepID=A0A4Y2WCV8_ARAVE|nr:hypothetical protein AVEN_96848-1 [Araneus ventricosus]